MKLSRREAIFGVATGIAILFGLSAMLAKSRIEQWKDALKDQAKCREQIEKDKILAGDREKWIKQFEELNKSFPPFGADQKMDVYWLSLMDSVATKNNVVISKRTPKEEKKTGDLYEMPIECQECEGSLESMVRFLFDLQVQGAMLDVRQLVLKPKSTTALRGRFTLFCAYTRAETGK